MRDLFQPSGKEAKLYREGYYALRSYLQSLPYTAPELREERYRAAMDGIAAIDAALREIWDAEATAMAPATDAPGGQS
jgi:hypothetical protein